MKKRLDALLPIIIIAVSVVAELVLGNFVYFAYVCGRDQTSDLHPEVQVHTVTPEDNQIYFGDLDLEVNSVKLTFHNTNPFSEQDFVTVGVYSLDVKNGYGLSFVTSQQFPLASFDSTHTIYCNSNTNTYGLMLTFENFEGEIEVTSVTVNPSYTVQFDAMRFGFMLLLGTALYLYKSRPEVPTLSYKSRHRRSLAAGVAVCAGCTLAVIFLNSTGETTELIAYPLAKSVDAYDPYVQQFDAFMKGQLHLDVVPDRALLSLGNPYDPSTRDGIYYLWDRAFFNGKYYSYFGIAPLLTVYFPFYFIIGALPSAGFVMSVFGMMTAVFFALAVEEYAVFSGKKNFGYLPAFCAASGFLSSFALIILRGQSRFYYIASMAGLAFSAAFIYFMLKAVGSKKATNRLVFFAISGICFGLGFLSRVNSVLPLAAVAGVFVILWAIKRIREKNISLFIGEAAALGLPVAAALAVSMIYNEMRFGSFFDFGTAYQLTVTDTSLYSVEPLGIVPAFFHYFLQSFSFTNSFPFMGFDYISLTDYGRYVYVDNGLGIFAMPFMLLLLACPFIFKKKSIGTNRKILFATALAMLPITAFLDFCLGGVIFRYTADFSLIAAFLACVIALEASDGILGKFGKDGYLLFRKGLFALGGVNAAVATGAMLMTSGNLVSASPFYFEMIKNTFVFWN
ncbi:MAG: hypothetical protein J6R20_09285 [Clostridia bacterium]|nr:hypothetical protein [Clostridia bacterium]